MNTGTVPVLARSHASGVVLGLGPPSTDWPGTGRSQWHVYTFIAHRPIRSLKAKIGALTGRTSQQNPRDVLIRLNQIMRGWANYFRHAVCKHILHSLAHFAWVAGGPVVADAAPLEVEGRPAPVDHARWAVAADHGGRDRVVQPRSGAGYPVPMAGTVESPVR